MLKKPLNSQDIPENRHVMFAQWVTAMALCSLYQKDLAWELQFGKSQF